MQILNLDNQLTLGKVADMAGFDHIRDISDFRYRCASCDKIHTGLPDITCAHPEAYTAIPESERRQRCWIDSDVCVIDDEQFYVRCLLKIPLVGVTGRFGWGVWSSLSEESFLTYTSIEWPRAAQPSSFFGWLCSELPGYPQTIGLACNVLPQPDGDRPLITFHWKRHQLVADQQRGISFERAVELVTLSGITLIAV